MKLVRLFTLFVCSTLPISAEGRIHTFAKAMRRVNIGASALAACTVLLSAYNAYSYEQQQTPNTTEWYTAYWQRPEASQENLENIRRQNAQLTTQALSWYTCRDAAVIIALGTGLIGTVSYLLEKATA